MLPPKLIIVIGALFCTQVFSTPLDRPVLSSKSISEKYQEIDFSPLNSHVNYVELEDPFWELDYDVLDKLAVIIEYLDAKTAGKPVSTAQTQEHDKLKAELEGEGVDVDGLMDIRQQLIVQWKSQNESTNPLILNKNIKIQGFVLPIEWQGKKLSEFLLVPFVGACIHKPTPPPNQVIYAKLSTPINFPKFNTFALVTVKGFLASELLSPELSLVDGKEPVTTSYTLDAVSVEVNDVPPDTW